MLTVQYGFSRLHATDAFHCGSEALESHLVFGKLIPRPCVSFVLECTRKSNVGWVILILDIPISQLLEHVSRSFHIFIGALQKVSKGGLSGPETSHQCATSAATPDVLSCFSNGLFKISSRDFPVFKTDAVRFNANTSGFTSLKMW